MTRFQNVPRLKKYAILWSVLLLLFVTLTACTQPAQNAAPTAAPTATGQDATSSATPETPATEGEEGAQLELTLEELAAFNGKEGKPAYVAVDGVIYDMTNSAMWKNGQHSGFEAGQDLTEAIKTKSPHGVGKLANVPVVGKIKE